MQDNDYNIIKPVENLQNVGALSPLDRHPEKRRKQSRQDNHGSAPDEQENSNETTNSGNTNDQTSSIDYRA
jgi:hypothetical protein